MYNGPYIRIEEFELKERVGGKTFKKQKLMYEQQAKPLTLIESQVPSIGKFLKVVMHDIMVDTKGQLVNADLVDLNRSSPARRDNDNITALGRTSKRKFDFNSEETPKVVDTEGVKTDRVRPLTWI